MTPNSTPIIYCPGLEFLKRCDLRTVADWASDNGVRVGVTPPSTDPDPNVVAADPNVNAALLDASGMFESALLKGDRYNPVDVLLMVGFTPNPSPPPTFIPIVGFVPSAGTAYIYRVVAHLTEGLLWRRRPDLSPFPPLFDWAMDQLDQLQDGGKILPFVEAQTAGFPGHSVDVTTDVETRGLVVTQAKRFLGTRGFELNG